MRIADGSSEDHPTPLPLDESASPALARPTVIASAPGPGNQTPAFDAVSDQSGRLRAYESDARAAMQAGMDARVSMLGMYESDIRPLGADYGSQPALPIVPEAATAPSNSFLYPWQGDEPVPNE
jgi:hypothetical protein